jgi:hypothetical protein
LKFEKSIKIPIPDVRFGMLTVGVSDAPSFEECDKFIVDELEKSGMVLDDRVRRVLGWSEK